MGGALSLAKMLRTRVSNHKLGLLAAPISMAGTRVVVRKPPVQHSIIGAQLCPLFATVAPRSIVLRAAAVAVAPPSISRGDTTGATMVVDDVWVQVGQ